MFSERHQLNLLNWFKRNKIVSILIASLFANAWQYRDAGIRETRIDEISNKAAAFYEQVYHIEVNRVSKWENIFQSERESRR